MYNTFDIHVRIIFICQYSVVLVTILFPTGCKTTLVILDDTKELNGEWHNWTALNWQKLSRPGLSHSSVYTSCLYHKRDTAWLVSPVLSLSSAQINNSSPRSVYVNVDFEMRSCANYTAQSGNQLKQCRETLAVGQYTWPPVGQPKLSTKSTWFDDHVELKSSVTPDRLWSSLGTYEAAKHANNITLQLTLTAGKSIIAIRNTGACAVVSRVRVYVYECAAADVGDARFPRTIPSLGSHQPPSIVYGTCVNGAQALPRPSAMCLRNGEWSLLNACHCAVGSAGVDGSCKLIIGPPTNLRMYNNGDDGVELSWKAPKAAENMSQTIAYHIECNNCRTNVVITPNATTTKKKVTVLGVRPEMRYQFRVFAFNKIHFSTKQLQHFNYASVEIGPTVSLDKGETPRKRSVAVPVIVLSTISITICACFAAFYIMWRKRKLHYLWRQFTILPEKFASNRNVAYTNDTTLKTANENQPLYVNPCTFDDPHEAVVQFTKEISASCITIEAVIGGGQFGDVCRGILRTTGSSEKRTVAVKTLKSHTSAKSRLDFLMEASIMGQFRNRNVILLEGVITKTSPVMIITEFMKNGSLDEFMKRNKHCLNVMDMLEMLQGIAMGMEYLASIGFIHRDLAARNILVNDEKICKISDFGLSREVKIGDLNNAVYTASGGIIAVRWTAPEALHRHHFTTASDVWSFGVVAWEVASYGTRPYWDWPNADVVRLVDAGYRLPPPASPSPPPQPPRALTSSQVQPQPPQIQRGQLTSQVHTRIPSHDQTSHHLRTHSQMLVPTHATSPTTHMRHTSIKLPPQRSHPNKCSSGASSSLHQLIMCRCWAANPAHRPTFTQLVAQLTQLIRHGGVIACRPTLEASGSHTTVEQCVPSSSNFTTFPHASVRDWLQSLGLEVYLTIFTCSGISTIYDAIGVTLRDLIIMGITSHQHQAIILNSIATVRDCLHSQQPPVDLFV